MRFQFAFNVSAPVARLQQAFAINTNYHMPLSLNTIFAMNKRQARELLRDSQHWSAARLQELQWTRLQSLLQHAYDSCPFYQKRMEQSGLHPRRDFHSFSCLQKLPILTKADIQHAAPQMLTTDPQVTGITANSTGGSTGKPLNFYQDDHYRLWADAARTRAWRHLEGVSHRAIEAVLWGADRDVGRKVSYKSLLKSALRRRSIALNTFDLDPAAIRKFFRCYNLLRPQILRGYASSLSFVADFIESAGLKVWQPRIILSSAEMLWPAMREKVSRVFGADVIDSYGCREVSQIATECRCHNGLHLVMENQFVEVVDGQILVTNLNNLAMPFIRYQVGDLAERIETQPCACGRKSHRLMGLKGRDNDNIELPGGKVINGEFFEFLFFGFETVEQFQVIYSRSQEQLLVRIQVRDQTEKIDEMVVRRMKESFGFHNVRVEFTDNFAKTPTGKFRFVYAVDRFEEPCSHVT